MLNWAFTFCFTFFVWPYFSQYVSSTTKRKKNWFEPEPNHVWSSNGVLVWLTCHELLVVLKTTRTLIDFRLIRDIACLGVWKTAGLWDGIVGINSVIFLVFPSLLFLWWTRVASSSTFIIKVQALNVHLQFWGPFIMFSGSIGSQECFKDMRSVHRWY